MPGLEDVVAQQQERHRRGIENGRRLELLAAERLREYRDLMIARKVQPDDVYRLSRTEEQVTPQRPGIFQKPDPPFTRASMNLVLARRGWVVSDSNVGSEYMPATGGLFIAEDGNVRRYVARGIGPSEDPKFGPSHFTGIPLEKLRPSAYFVPNQFLISADDGKVVQLDHYYGLDIGLEQLATAARRYLS